MFLLSKREWVSLRFSAFSVWVSLSVLLVLPVCLSSFSAWCLCVLCSCFPSHGGISCLMAHSSFRAQSFSLLAFSTFFHNRLLVLVVCFLACLLFVATRKEKGLGEMNFFVATPFSLSLGFSFIFKKAFSVFSFFLKLFADISKKFLFNNQKANSFCFLPFFVL